MATLTFDPTGAIQPWVVPDDVARIEVTLRGASGLSQRSTTFGDKLGGRGSVVTGKLDVVPGETLYIFVGDKSGFGGGGVAGGGGASDIRRGGTNLASRLCVAAGGGGAGNLLADASNSGRGGDAGYPAGAAGTPGTFGGTGGTGATQAAGGSAGGGLGQGGTGTNGSGGGGGGYYGGGGGVRSTETNASTSGGGGGSSWLGALVDGSHTLGPATTAADYNGQVVITTLNSPPNAPQLVTMANGETVDLNVVQRAEHVHSDPNGEPQSAFDLRYRLLGATTWTTVHRAVPSEFYDFPAGSLSPGTYERQVRTYDSLGNVGPYSASGFFAAAAVPGAPTITAPANGATVGDQATTVTWSTASQQAYQLRRVADDGAGAPDPDEVYEDTGVVVSGVTRARQITFETNHRVEHVQLRIRRSGLWSPWAGVRVNIDYDQPPAPTFTVTPDPATASLLVTVINPAPGAGELAAAWNDVYITERIDGVLVEERRATGVPVNGSWRYWTPVSGQDYAATTRVVAAAANGTTASS